jgi:hypothetical protein
MSGLTALLRHEIAGRRQLFLAAGVLGLLSLATPLLTAAMPAAAAATPELRETLALALAMMLSGVAAVLLGASAIGPDLAENRLGFFFSRPLSGWAIWAGKLLGAALCAWITGLLVLLPALLVALATADLGGLLHNSVISGSYLALWTIALPLPILAAHAASVMLRTRSPWLIVDLLAAAAVSGILWVSVRRLLYWGVLQQAVDALPLLAVAAGVALLAASAVQVLGGRTDAARGHRLLSLILAALGLAGALAFAAGAQRLIGAGPLALAEWSALQATPGDGWVALVGSAAGPPEHRASFLLQPATGRSIRTRTAAFADMTLPLDFSDDGRRAAWVELLDAPHAAPGEILRLDLDRPGARPRRTLIGVAEPRASSLALSPHGSRLAVAERGRLAVYDLDSGRLLAAPAVANATDVAVRFRGEDRLVVLAIRLRDAADGTIGIYDLDLHGGRLVERTTIPYQAYLWTLSPDGSRLVFNQLRNRGAVLFDLATGRQLAELRQPGEAVWAFFLRDGRLAETLHTGRARTELRLLDRDGREPAGSPRIQLPPQCWVEPAQPMTDHLLAVAMLPGPGGTPTRTWEVVDLRRASVRPLGSGLEPLRSSSRLARAGSSPLFVERDQLVRIDLDTGRRQVLGPARPYYPRPYLF